MNRIILHWSAGGHTANASDRRHYHFIVEGDGKVIEGNHPPEANARIANPSDGNTYAAHTLGANTGSIGVAVAAMRGAQEAPFTPGPSPITPEQVDSLTRLCAALCARYSIPVERATVLSHAEVERTLGIRQRGKWDISWLPGMPRPGDPVEVGDRLREMIRQLLTPPAPPAPSGWAAFIAAVARLFRRD